MAHPDTGVGGLDKHENSVYLYIQTRKTASGARGARARKGNDTLCCQEQVRCKTCGG